jgi:hypothetical protein
MRNLFSILIIITTLCSSMAVLSHHSFSAEFDVGRPINITGAITNVEWTNPHAWLHLAVEDEQGNIQHWAVEMLGVNAIVRSGMTPQTVKNGNVLSITGFGSRDGTNTANASSVTRTETGESLWSSARE